MTLDPRVSDPERPAVSAAPPTRSADWPVRRLELLTWFRTHATPLADAYEGAVRMLHDTSFPGRVHLIAHIVRDIADRLVFVLDPQLPPGRVQYENAMDGISELWPTLQTLGHASDGKAPQESVPIDYRLAVMIDSLVLAHRERRKRPSSHELLFRHLMRNEPTRAEVNQRLVSDFKKMRDWFMGLAHLRKERPDVNEGELHTQFTKFEGMLHSFVGRFFTGTAELDELLQQANR